MVVALVCARQSLNQALRTEAPHTPGDLGFGATDNHPPSGSESSTEHHFLGSEAARLAEPLASVPLSGRDSCSPDRAMIGNAELVITDHGRGPTKGWSSPRLGKIGRRPESRCSSRQPSPRKHIAAASEPDPVLTIFATSPWSNGARSRETARGTALGRDRTPAICLAGTRPTVPPVRF